MIVIRYNQVTLVTDPGDLPGQFYCGYQNQFLYSTNFNHSNLPEFRLYSNKWTESIDFLNQDTIGI